MATTYLERTQTAGSQTTWTLSYWVKFSGISGNNDMCLWTTGTDATSNCSKIEMSGSGTDGAFQFQDTGTRFQKTTNRLFRDTSGWYNFVIAVDTTLVAADDRIKIYVNGVQETSFLNSTNPAQDLAMYGVNSSGDPVMIGRGGDFGSSVFKYFDGLMTHIQFVDGLQLAPTEFGEVDATSGIWKIKTGCYATPGTNGFCLKMETTTGSAMGTDSSGEGNNFTEGGSPTQAIDNPSNVYCTVNSLDNYMLDGTFSNGNTTVATASGGGSSYTYSTSTFGVSTGKWYWETKYVSKTGGTAYPMIGISSFQSTANSQELGHHEHDWGYLMDVTSKLRNNDASIAWGDNFTEGDIIGVGLDLDNNKLYFAVNGTWVNSGVPTSGATGTGAISITAPASTPKGAYFASVCYWDGTYGGTFDNNFGNGYFGITQVSSAGTSSTDDDSIWEYDCPTGYYGLNTNNRNTYG